MTSWYSIARSNSVWVPRGNWAISSRKTVPGPAVWNKPGCASLRPNNCPSSCSTGLIPQLTDTNFASLFGPAVWISLANNSFPVPVSPTSNTLEFVAATFRMVFSRSCSTLLLPVIWSKPSERSRSLRSFWFSRYRSWNLNSRSSLLVSSSKFTGLTR